METTPLIKSKEYAARFNDRLSMNDLLSANILWQYLQKFYSIILIMMKI